MLYHVEIRLNKTTIVFTVNTCYDLSFLSYNQEIYQNSPMSCPEKTSQHIRHFVCQLVPKRCGKQ